MHAREFWKNANNGRYVRGWHRRNFRKKRNQYEELDVADPRRRSAVQIKYSSQERERGREREGEREKKRE